MNRIDAKLATLPMAVLTAVLLSNPATAASSRPPVARAEPFDGSLTAGKTVRAIVLSSTAPFPKSISALRRSEPGPWSGEELYFENKPDLELDEPTLVVFKVTGSSPIHTPPDASGMVEYIQVTFAEWIAVEMSESAAVARARACAVSSQEDSRITAAPPFTHGPGRRGGWLVRFPTGPASTGKDGTAPATLEFEISADGSCHRIE